MAGDFYTKTGNPSTNAAGESSVIRNEFALIETGLNKLLQLTGNGSKFWRVNSGATAVEGVSATGSGNVVLATSPTLVTPVLGTPASGTLTNCTGLPVATGISGLGANAATALAVAVGSAGAVVVNGGVLGTPSSGTLTNCTGLPVATGISGLAAGIAAWLADPTSAKLATALTDENGTGKVIFSAGTLAVASGKTLTASNTLTLTGTDGTTLNINAVTVLNRGTYTPTSGSADNITGSVTIGEFGWLRVGSEVMVRGQVSFEHTANNADTSFTLTLPVASTFTGSDQASGVAILDGTTMHAFKVQSAAGTTVFCYGRPTADAGSSHTMNMEFMYRVI